MKTCPHAAPFVYCEQCEVTPCPVGLDKPIMSGIADDMRKPGARVESVPTAAPDVAERVKRLQRSADAADAGYLDGAQVPKLLREAASALAEAGRERERLRAIADMLDAVVEGAQTEFVRVPYGASREDVVQINDWHAMAKEARAALAARGEE